MLAFLGEGTSSIVGDLRSTCCFSQGARLRRRLGSVTSTLRDVSVRGDVGRLHSSSLRLLGSGVAGQCGAKREGGFAVGSVGPGARRFLGRCPIILDAACSTGDYVDGSVIFSCIVVSRTSRISVGAKTLTLSYTVGTIVINSSGRLPGIMDQRRRLTLGTVRAACRISSQCGTIARDFLRSYMRVFQSTPMALLERRCHYRPGVVRFYGRHFCGKRLVTVAASRKRGSMLRIVQAMPNGRTEKRFGRHRVSIVARRMLPRYARSKDVNVVAPCQTRTRTVGGAIKGSVTDAMRGCRKQRYSAVVVDVMSGSPARFSSSTGLLGITVSHTGAGLYLIAGKGRVPRSSGLDRLVDCVRCGGFRIGSDGLRSIFSLLCRRCATRELTCRTTRPTVSRRLSRGLVCSVLLGTVARLNLPRAKVLYRCPLSELVTS